MNSPSRSILVFGVYILLVGLSLFFVPNVITSIFGLPEPTEAWVKLVGALVFALGLYYIQATRDNNVAFYRMTVWVRAIFVVMFVIIALTNAGYINLLLFAAVDALGTVWTWYALRQAPAMKPSMA